MTPRDLIVTPRGVRFMGAHFPCVIGRGGITDTKKEGDGATPIGVHDIVGCYYRPDRLTAPNAWAEPIRPGDLWSDDPKHAAYNSHVRAPYPYSHEMLRRADPLYDLVLVTDWNWPHAVPGHGSAIFIHQWRKRCMPTEGCVAFARSHLHWIARNIAPDTRLIVTSNGFS